MRYIDIGGEVVPKHCIYGPRPAEGIVFNNIEWWSITDHLVKDQREKEYAAVQRAKEEAKKQISYDMTRNWSNTLASIKTQANQKRLEKSEKEKQDKIDQYNEILKNRKLEKEEILANIKKIMFEDHDAVKTMTSAVGYALVLEGRKKQIEFQNAIRNEEAKKENEWALDVKKKAEEFEREQLQEKIRHREKIAIQRKYLDEQVADIKRRRKADEDELAEEKKDLINMKIEGEKIHHCNMVEKNYRKEFAAKYMKKSDAQIEFQRKLALEEEEENEINKIYLNFDRKFKRERKEREEKIKKEQVERRIQIAEKLAEKLREAAKKEEDRLRAAAEEKERDAMREEASKKELNELALKSLLDGKRKSEQRKARQEYEKREQKKWELMQQYRSAEINDEWRESEKRRKDEEQKKVTAFLDCQVKELRQRRENELKELMEQLTNDNAEMEEVLKYCQETMDYVREENLPEYPVLAAISQIKRSYGIRDKNQDQPMQQHLGNHRKGNPRSSITGCFCFKY